MSYDAIIPFSLGQILLRSDGISLQGLYFLGQGDCPDLPGIAPKRLGHFDPSAGLRDGHPLRSFKPHRADLADSGSRPASLGDATGKADCVAPEPDAVSMRLLQADVPTGAQALFQQTLKELSEYQCGLRQVFDIPLDPAGTEFQRAIWQALLQIPFGRTVTYGEVARMAGYGPGYGRAAGAAVGSNPISIIIPCHRVLATGGKLNGYGGGLERKVGLLEIEGYVI